MTPTPEIVNLRRPEIRKLFRRNRGAAADLARTLMVTESVISRWLRGYTVSRPIAVAAHAKAVELLARERPQ